MRVLSKLEDAPFHMEGIEQQYPPDKGLAEVQKEFDDFGRLHAAGYTEQRGKNTGLRTSLTFS
jgi:hypothetical protein